MMKPSIVKLLNFRFLILSFLLFCISATFFGQEKWTLNSCIKYALDNNIQVKREKLNTLKHDNALQQAKWDVLPDLNARFIHAYKTGYSLNDISSRYTEASKNIGYMEVESNLTLFHGFSNLNTIKLKQFELQKSLSEYHEFRNTVILSVAMAYLEVLLNQEILEMAKSQLIITEQQVEKTNKLVKVGNLAKGELLKIQALAANDKLSLVQSKNKLDLSYLSLVQLLELDSADGFEIFIPEIFSFEQYQVLSVEEAFSQALDNLPQIKTQELQIKSNEKKLEIERAKASPEIKFRTDWSSFYSDTFDSLYNSTMKQVSGYQEMTFNLDVSIPIFNKLQANRNVSNAKIDLLDAEYALEMKRKLLYKQIQQTHADAIAAYNKYYTAIDAVSFNEEAFNYTQQKFNVGLVTLVDYNLSKNELLKARTELLISKYEYVFLTKILNFYTGKPFIL